MKRFYRMFLMKSGRNGMEMDPVCFKEVAECGLLKGFIAMDGLRRLKGLEPHRSKCENSCFE